MAGGLQRYGARLRPVLAPVMRASQGRVHTTAAALTPVRTGRMRSLLRETPTNGGLGYVVGWLDEDFRGEAQEFYAPYVVLGTRYMAARDPLTPAIESERPVLLKELGVAMRSVARG